MERKFKQGDARQDGKLFWRYHHREKSVQEEWVSPEQFARNKEKLKIYKKKHYLANWDAIQVEARARVKRWREGNPERFKRAHRNHYAANKDKYYVHSSNRKAWLRAGRTKAAPDQNKIMTTMYTTAKRTSQCLGVRFEVDHHIPISKGGAHLPGNLRILPWKINRSKGTKLPPK